MSDYQETPYLYLTTIGRKSGKPHQIEIWFVERQGRYYMVNEDGNGDWVKNIRSIPHVTFSVGTRSDEPIDGMGRVVDSAAEPELTAAVKALMDAKYQWSDGLIVELTPNH
jgi:deazaflavin-dependent oxidoreductase (nitroreductase family)